MRKSNFEKIQNMRNSTQIASKISSVTKPIEYPKYVYEAQKININGPDLPESLDEFKKYRFLL